MLLLSSADFFQIKLLKKYFRNTIRESKGLNLDQDQDKLFVKVISRLPDYRRVATRKDLSFMQRNLDDLLFILMVGLNIFYFNLINVKGFKIES